MLNHKLKNDIIIKKDIERLKAYGVDKDVVRWLAENDEILTKHVDLEYYYNMSNKN